MKRKMKLYFLIPITVLGPLLSLSSDDTVFNRKDDSGTITRADYRQIIRRLHKLDYNLRFEGEIVDPNGTIISDVKVSSSKSKDVMSNSYDKDTFIVKNGTFTFDAKDVFTWGLTFEKEGYYKTVIPLGVAQISSAIERGDKSLTLHDDFILKRAKVVLFPYGKMNSDLLEVEDNILTFSENGENKVIRCVIIPYYTNNGKNQRRDDEFKISFFDEKRLPENLIYITPGYNEDGSHDGTIRLKTNGEDSGFLLQEYRLGTHCFRSMWEAPEDAVYRPEIIISDGLSNYLQHNYIKSDRVRLNVRSLNKSLLVPKNVPPLVFYFKVNGFYGKGLALPSDNEDSKLERSYASLRVFLYVNRMKGVRNTNIWLSTDW